jgi:hypothetical protein
MGSVAGYHLGFEAGQAALAFHELPWQGSALQYALHVAASTSFWYAFSVFPSKTDLLVTAVCWENVDYDQPFLPVRARVPLCGTICALAFVDDLCHGMNRVLTASSAGLV